MAYVKNTQDYGTLGTTLKPLNALSNLNLRRVVVHRFKVSDGEDPDLYAAQPLWEWERSEMGQWVMKHAVETPIWKQQTDFASCHINYAIIAVLQDRDYTFWQLKWGTPS